MIDTYDHGHPEILKELWKDASPQVLPRKHKGTPSGLINLPQRHRGSSTDADRTLATHLRDVGARAAEFANALGFETEIVEALKRSGQLHDIGKLESRFQSMLCGGNGARASVAVPLAKSERQDPGAWKRSGLPNTGFRHEAISFSHCENADESELVKHLVASHHGYARPLYPIIEEGGVGFQEDDFGVQVTLKQGTQLDPYAPARLVALARTYGWWGLGALESILRLADGLVSSELDGE